MRKTHKTTMANKQHLIEDLQDIIEERDRMIRQLQGDDRDTESTAGDNDKVTERDISFCSAINFCIFVLSSCNAEVESVECHLHALMCSVSVVTVVFIHTMEDDQRLNTLVHEGDTLHFTSSLQEDSREA